MFHGDLRPNKHPQYGWVHFEVIIVGRNISLKKQKKGEKKRTNGGSSKIWDSTN
jgi:hypothetical protein